MEDTMENVDTVHAGPEESGKTKKEKKPHGVIFWGFLFLICVIVATIASSGTAALFELGMYESKDAFRRNVNEYLMDGYAVQALSDHKGDFQFEEFENSNFQYAVLESDDIENEDLTDKDTYLVCSLDEEDLKHARHLYCYSATVSDDTQFSYSTESLFDSYGYVSTNRNPDVSVKKDETKNYYLYATVRSPLDETQDDLFTRSKPYVDLACKLCLLPVLLAMIGWIATCVCFVFGFLAFVRLIKRIWKFVSEQCRDNVPLLWRLIAVFAVCALVSFFFTVVAINLPPLVFCVWLLHIGVVGCLFVFAALQLNRIKKGADRLVEGTFDTPVNTKGMFFDFKSIAESINKASDGMEAA
nr:hypothetical protein [Lachnospiraceae bacterium]